MDLILLQNDLQMYREIVAIDLACWKHTTEVLSGVKLENGNFLPSFDEYPPELMAQLPKDDKYSVVNENIKKMLDNSLNIED